MENHLNKSAKYWWTSLIVGVLAILTGIISIAEPMITIGILTIFFIASFFLSGISEIIFAILNRKQIDRWGWMLTGGVINLAFACILLAYPMLNILMFIYYISFYILLQTILAIWASFALKSLAVPGWKSHLVLALLGFALALFLIFNPMFAAKFITIIFAFAFICYGIFRVRYAFKLKELK